MLNTPKMKQLYQRIQKQLFYMIPEKWDRIYLYASVVENINKLEVGEMFFYYYPKGVFKKNPVNVYEIVGRFNIDEDEYTKLVDNLYTIIKELRECFFEEEKRYWSNITIKIEEFKFSVEYNFDDLIHSKLSAEERHIIWQEMYLDLPIERLNKKERILVEQYLEENKNINSKEYIYEEPIYRKEVKNIIEYDREDEIYDRMEESRLLASKYEEDKKTNQDKYQTEKIIQKRKDVKEKIKYENNKLQSLNSENIEQIKRKREQNKTQNKEQNEAQNNQKNIKQNKDLKKDDYSILYDMENEIEVLFNDTILNGKSISLKPMDDVLKRKKENKEKNNKNDKNNN